MPLEQVSDLRASKTVWCRQECFEDLVSDRIPETRGRVLSVGRTTMPPTNWLAGEGLRVVDTDANTILARTANYLSMIDPTLVQTGRRSRLTELSPASRLEDPLLEVASVEIALSTDPTTITGSFEPLTAVPTAESDSTLIVSAALEPRPRARLMFRHSTVRDAADARSALRAQVEHLGGRVIVEGAPEEFTCKQPSSEPELEWLVDGANRQQFRVDVGDGRGFLFVADAYAPGWKATIDGEPAAVLPANLAFRAVALDEGEHVVEFRYEPLAWTLGGILVWSGLLLMVGVWALGRSRARRGRA